MTAVGFAVEQPFQEVQPVLEERGTTERRTRGDHGLRDGGVCVGETSLGPRPHGRPGTAMVSAASESSERADAWSGSKLRTSAAPNAANAMALGHVDR